jgi:TonB family protein
VPAPVPDLPPRRRGCCPFADGCPWQRASCGDGDTGRVPIQPELALARSLLNAPTVRHVLRLTPHTLVSALLLARFTHGQNLEAPPPAETPPAQAPSSEQPPAEPPPRTTPTPPALVRSVEPTYPESERARGSSATVGLVLTIDSEGKVTDAVVSESASPDFDAAALSAARELVFTPARMGETPIAAKIPFRFEFKLRDVAPAGASGLGPQASAPATAAVPPPSSSASPSPATPGTPAAAASAAPVEGEVLDISVEGERPPREPTLRTIETVEITKAPGSNGDALRAITNLPGIARPPGLDGLLIVRGSAPNDTLTFVDGTSVPIAYHFGGLSSVIPSEMLERIDFYPGNFGPELGRASGGAIDVGVRSPKGDRFAGMLQIDLLDARFVAEAPLGKDTRFILAGRRSWLDLWLGPALESTGAVSVSVAPVYYDGQALIEHDISKDTTLRLFAFGSSDALELLLEAPDSTDPAIGGTAAQSSRFWRVQARSDTRFSKNARWRNTIAVGNDRTLLQFGEIRADSAIDVIDARSDLRLKLNDTFTTVVGVDVQAGSYDVFWRFPPLDVERGEAEGPIFGRPLTELQGTGKLFRPGGYLMLETTPARGLKLLPSMRADYSKDTGDWTVDPRFGFRYDLFKGERRTTLKGGIGVYHQPPEPYESVAPFGSPNVQSQRAIHYSLGVEHELSRPLEVSLEGFYKDLDKVVVSVPAADTAANGISYQNSGSGRSYGAELLLRYKPVGRFFGWVAYTLSRSERKDGPNQPWYTFEYDQTHILTALASVSGRAGFEGWRLGARFRYVTGSPYTANIGGVMDYDAGAYAPIDDPVPYSSRSGAFYQLDLRIDKTWKFQSWQLGAYLDLQNATNHQSPEGVYYNYDFSESKVLKGLPLLPILGIRGEI